MEFVRGGGGGEVEIASGDGEGVCGECAYG